MKKQERATLPALVNLICVGAKMPTQREAMRTLSSVTFYDALSGEKRKLNVNQKTVSPTPAKSWCAGAKWAHDWDDTEDDCNKCGATVLFVRALRNIDRPKH